jgi:hypothetical protein
METTSKQTSSIRRWGRNIPRCKDGKNHNWKDGVSKYGESGICLKCGYDICDGYYKELKGGLKE